MRKLSWLIAAVCLVALPVCAQSRHRGYQAAGGWHRKISTAPVQKREKKQDRRNAPQTSLPPVQVPATPPPAR